MVPDRRRCVRWGWLGLLMLGGVALAAGWLVVPAQAAPAEGVAEAPAEAPPRGTATRMCVSSASCPPAAALAGIVGVIVAGRLRERRLGQIVSIAAPLLALGLALGPLYMIGPRPLNRQPSPDAQEYADAARHLAAGDGYVTTIYRNETRPPRYPPGSR